MPTAACPVITSGPTLEDTYEGLPAVVTLHTILGRRKSQEDRFCIAPQLASRHDNVGFFGVFDGTVGDFASDTVKDIIVPILKNTAPYQELEKRNEELTPEEKVVLLRQAFRSMYSLTDQELLKRCGIHEKHYATCTSVTLLMWQDLICVGHLGDSRVCLIYATNDNIAKFGDSVKKASYAITEKGTVAVSGNEDGSTSNSDKDGTASNNDIDKDSTASESNLSSEAAKRDSSGSGVTDSTKTSSEPDNAETQGGQDIKENNYSKGSLNAEGSHSATASSTVASVTSAEGHTNDKGEKIISSKGNLSNKTSSHSDPRAKWTAPNAILTRSVPFEKIDHLIEGNFVTKDHKPDMQEERARIEASGGSVEYLQNHQNKPFIRGGDFQQRKQLGESPMQLQYSRAFGGKDLKPFGLVADPTINVTRRERQFIGFILASDGLWDVVGADAAARVAMKAYVQNRNPSQALVSAAYETSGDNITAMCVFYDTMGGD